MMSLLSRYVGELIDWFRRLVTGYVVAAGFFVLAFLFLIVGAVFGLGAAFQALQLRFGVFPAYGLMGGGAAVLMLISALIGGIMLKRPSRGFPRASKHLKQAQRQSLAAIGDIEKGLTRNGPRNSPVLLTTGALILAAAWAASTMLPRRLKP